MIKIITHHQNFHVDEVMAIALLLKYYVKNEKHEIIRTRDRSILTEAKTNNDIFVIDVGGEYDFEKKNFDHHQNDSSLVWEDGTPLSSCGLIWKWLRKTKRLNQFMNDETMNKIEEDLIKLIDAHDNGDYWVYSGIINGYNRKDGARQDYKFSQALNCATQFYDNFFYNLRNLIKGEKEMKKAIEKSRSFNELIISDCKISGSAVMAAKMSKKSLIAYPRTKDSWVIEAVSKSDNNKFSMPLQWRGLTEDNIKRKTGIDNLIFCHKNGHLCMLSGTKEDLIKISDIITQYNNYGSCLEA